MHGPEDLQPGTVLGRLSLAVCDALDILNAADADSVRPALDDGDLAPLCKALRLAPAEIKDRLEELRYATLALITLVGASRGAPTLTRDSGRVRNRTEVRRQPKCSTGHRGPGRRRLK